MTTVTEPTQDTLQKSTDENQSNSNSNSELIKRHELDRAPWVIVEHEKGYFVAIGQQKLSEDFNTLTEAIEHTKTGHFAMQLIITLASAVFELKNQSNNN